MSYKRWINSPFTIHLFVTQVFNRIASCIAHTEVLGLDRTTGGYAPATWNPVIVLKKKKAKKSTLSIQRDCVNQPILKSSRPVFLGLKRAVMHACDEISLMFELDSSISTVHPWELTALLLPVYFISS